MTIPNDPAFKPRLRPLEAFELPDEEEMNIGLRDRGGLSTVMLSVSGPVLNLLAMMDGETSVASIRRKFADTFGQEVPEEALHSLLTHLDEAHFLESPSFDRYYQQLQEEYRAQGVRERKETETFGIEGDPKAFFDEILQEAPVVSLPGFVRGLVAPHLDYGRGRSCYAAAYAAIRDRPTPQRVVILGTNHFGRGRSVVATGNAFVTPLGRTETDVVFLQAVEETCGSLRDCELDHRQEHSIELELLWLQHLFGPSTFQMAAFLCPDPCRPTGTAPPNGEGVDLRVFAEALRDVVAGDGADTLLVAGADLSHVGRMFGDERPISTSYLESVEAHDLRALEKLETNDPEGFRAYVAERDNRTGMCSVGCLYTLASALPAAKGTRLGYHQAVDSETDSCVTCAAIAFV